MKNALFVFFMLCIGTSMKSLYADDNKLFVVRTAPNTLEVQFANSDEVGGIQFSVRASSNIALGNLERGTRTAESGWMVDSYKSNDSTVNAIVINMERKNLPAGDGMLARIPFIMVRTSERSWVSLTNVIVTSPSADSLGVEIKNLEWSNEHFFNPFILGNYPNPFNPSTKIQFTLEKDGWATLKVYNLIWQEVATLFEGNAASGRPYDVTFNAGNLANGLYIARLESAGQARTLKLMFMK